MDYFTFTGAFNLQAFASMLASAFPKHFCFLFLQKTCMQSIIKPQNQCQFVSYDSINYVIICICMSTDSIFYGIQLSKYPLTHVNIIMLNYI